MGKKRGKPISLQQASDLALKIGRDAERSRSMERRREFEEMCLYTAGEWDGLERSRNRWRLLALGLSGGLVLLALRVWGKLLWVALFG